MGRRLSDRGIAVEYVVILVLLAVGAILVFGRYGARVRDGVERSTRQVESLRASPNGAAGVEDAEGEPPLDLPAGASGAWVEEGELQVGNFSVDASTAIWLAALVVVIGVMMIYRILRVARKEAKNAE